MYHYEESGLSNVYLKNGYTIEEHPEYGELISIRNTRGLHKAIGHAIATKSTPLTGGEFRFLRIELNLSQKALSDLFGVSDQTIARYEKEERNISRTSELVIRNYYLQTFFGENKVKELTDKLSNLDSERIMLEIVLEEQKDTWLEAA